MALLMVFVVAVWLNVVEYRAGGSAAYRIMQMSEAGKVIILTIVWFQFCATQIVAVILLSTSISDEIYDRTLGVLMTTPINSFQIVMGKLFSKLLMLLMLLAISVPLLAVVRVFGGVPWGYLVSSVCITFTAVLFAASVSMLFSIFCRRAFAAVLLTFLTGGVLYALGPWLVGEALDEMNVDYDVIWRVLLPGSPFLTLAASSVQMYAPGPFAPTPRWALHCGIMLAASGCVLTACVIVVRRVALSQAVGGGRSAGRPREPAPAAQGRAVEVPAGGKVRRVSGSPIVWKELKTPLFSSWRRRLIACLVLGLVLLVAYVLSLEDLDDDDTHTIFIMVYTMVGLLSTTVLSATNITTERESRSWPILLATPLDDWAIVRGKLIGVVRRCLPIWLIPLGHCLVFSIFGFVHPVLLLHVFMLAVWAVLFLGGTGLLFGTVCRRTTAAVVANLGLALGIWLVVPLLVGLLAVGSGDGSLAELCADANPVFQAAVVTSAASGRYDARKPLSRLSYDWPTGDADFAGATAIMAAFFVGYVGAGLIAALFAKERLRRAVFR